jgi:transposase
VASGSPDQRGSVNRRRKLPQDWSGFPGRTGGSLRIDRYAGLSKDESPWAEHRSYSIEFKRQVAQEFLTGETLYGLAKRHDICRNLIRLWVQKYETGAFDEEAAAADLLQQYEARIAALERHC